MRKFSFFTVGPPLHEHILFAGASTPHPAPNHPPKYNPILSKFGSSVIPSYLSSDTKRLIHASLSSSSWKKHESAMNCFQKFDDSSPSLNTWPLSSKSVSEFITWAAVKQNLKAKTVKSYLGSLRFIHKLNNMPCENCSGFIPDTILKGIENCALFIISLLSHQLCFNRALLQVHSLLV